MSVCCDHTTIVADQVLSEHFIALGLGLPLVLVEILTALSCTYTTGFLKPFV